MIRDGEKGERDGWRRVKRRQWEGSEGGARDELVTENGREERRKGVGKEGAHSWVIQHGRPA